MTEHSRIDAELDGVRLTPDGERLVLLLRDTTGRKVSLSLPRSCLNEVLTVAPKPMADGESHRVATWTMSLAENGQSMILTLCTAEGTLMSFNITAWQADGIATVATYGRTREVSGRSVH